MKRTNRQMIVWRQTVYRARATLSLHDVATQCGLPPELVERFVDLGIIEPVDDHANHFTPDATLRLQRLLRLRRALGIIVLRK